MVWRLVSFWGVLALGLVPPPSHATRCLTPSPQNAPRRPPNAPPSKVGCDMGCKFCLTGKLGLAANLSAAQITEQLVEARRLQAREGDGVPITNIVYMGMGEPLHNLEAVLASAEAMAHPLGLHMSHNKARRACGGGRGALAGGGACRRPFCGGAAPAPMPLGGTPPNTLALPFTIPGHPPSLTPLPSRLHPPDRPHPLNPPTPELPPLLPIPPRSLLPHPHPYLIPLPSPQITVSTVGLVDRLGEFLARCSTAQLAVSLHATTDEVGTGGGGGRGGFGRLGPAKGGMRGGFGGACLGRPFCGSRQDWCRRPGKQPAYKRPLFPTNVPFPHKRFPPTPQYPIRDAIVPVNRRHDLASLLGALAAHFPRRRAPPAAAGAGASGGTSTTSSGGGGGGGVRRVLIEYVMLDGVNDSDEDAERWGGGLAARGLAARGLTAPFDCCGATAAGGPSGFGYGGLKPGGLTVLHRSRCLTIGVDRATNPKVPNPSTSAARRTHLAFQARENESNANQPQKKPPGSSGCSTRLRPKSTSSSSTRTRAPPSAAPPTPACSPSGRS